MEKLKGTSKDLLAENINELRKLFPEAFTEDKIDFETLKDLLGEYVEKDKERYSFNWAGKQQARREAQKVSTGTLRPCKDESVNFDTTENLYIEGDNLEVLKLLQKSYHNSIKLIYIDPPYNTGNDFIYKDNYHDNLKNYKEITGQIDSEGNKLTTNSDSSGRYHSNWLNMMYPRLKLARNLLKDDGVIFISIDENEIHNLRKLCDEIFGIDNFLSELVIKLRHENRILKGDKDFHEVFEYCLIYKKSNSYKQTKRIEDNSSINKYVNEIVLKGKPIENIVLDGKKVEVFTPDDYELIKHKKANKDLLQSISIRGTLKEGNSSGRFFMKHLNGIKNKYAYLYKVENMGNDKYPYRFFMKQPTENHANGIYFQGVPVDKKDTKEVPYPNFYDFVTAFNNAGYQGGIEFRNGKKPIEFLNKILTLSGITNDRNSIILDFFSGSASTGHALMNLNKEDGGNRKFIMVQLPEPTAKNLETYKEGYKTIAEIGKERIRRVISKIKEEQDEKIDNLDLGFKVLKLDSSNIKAWDSETENLEEDLLSAVNNIKEDRNQDDILYEIMLKYGLGLTLPIEKIEIAGNKVFNVGMGELICCLSRSISLDTVRGIGKLKEEINPENCRVVFMDNGFKDDVVKTNAMQILKKHGIEEVRSI